MRTTVGPRLHARRWRAPEHQLALEQARGDRRGADLDPGCNRMPEAGLEHPPSAPRYFAAGILPSTPRT